VERGTMNYTKKREIITRMMQKKGSIACSQYITGLKGGDDVDKILMLTELAIGAGQERSHFPTVRDAHESWMERILENQSKKEKLR